MRATTAIPRVARVNLRPHPTCAFVDQLRQQELRKRIGRGIAKLCALAPEQQRFNGDDRPIHRIRAFVMLAVKLDADAAPGDWTLDALVSRHGSLAWLKYSRPCKPCACRTERQGPPAASTCPVQDESLHDHLQPHTQALQDLDHSLVARLGARGKRLVEALPSKTGAAGNGRHSARLGDITNSR